jgi:hypothetical protein
MRWIEAAAWPEPMAWPSFDASGSGLRAEQRESKLVGKVGVCAKALQQRTWLASTIRCHVPGFARSFELGPWIADVRGGYNMIVLSSIKMGAPASNEGT